METFTFIASREPHHSKHELFKSSNVECGRLSDIVTRCNVHKLKNFIKLNNEERNSDIDFVYRFNKLINEDHLITYNRQMYDPYNKKFTPELEPECLCKKVITILYIEHRFYVTVIK